MQIAMPYLKRRLLPGRGKCIPREMLKAGWATVYEQAGAEYGDWSKEEHLALQTEAQSVVIFSPNLICLCSTSWKSFQKSESGYVEIWPAQGKPRRV